LSLEDDGRGKPVLQYGDGIKVNLVPAAMPRVDYVAEEGKSIDLVLEGLEMMVRLGWKEGKRVVEVWNGGTGETGTCAKG